MTNAKEPQTVPVRVYQTDDLIMLAAPMPGLAPEDITVKIDGDHVTIRGEQRGPRQDERDLLVVEWTIGPYFREITLPVPVSGQLTNATCGNGVLMLRLCKKITWHFLGSPKLAPAGSGGRKVQDKRGLNDCRQPSWSTMWLRQS